MNQTRYAAHPLLARLCFVLAACGCLVTAMPPNLTAQQPTAAPAEAAAAPPLPDPVALMRQVEINQRLAESIQKDYVFDDTQTMTERDHNGGVKKISSAVYQISWVDGVPQRRLIRKDGKPLSPEEQKKEDDRVAEHDAKARERREQGDAAGKETDPRGHDEVTLSRMLELGSFSNPRRVQINGRDTIAVDYTGDPKVKVHNPAEGAIHEMAGTVWVDEQDKTIEHLEGHFIHDYKVGGGLVASVASGMTFRLQNVRLNNEVWLPQTIEGHGHARMLLFFTIDGDFSAHMTDYHKFRASAKILPGLQKVDPDPAPAAIPAPAPPR